MCNRCNPRIARSVPLTPAIAAASRAIASLYEVHLAGGMAHVVTDDMNVDDEHVEWSLNACGPEDDRAAEALRALRPLTRLQRVAAIQRAWYT